MTERAAASSLVPSDPFRRDVALAAGEGDGAGDLLAVERFARLVRLNHRDLAQLDPLEGGEPRAAAFALAAAADRRAVFGGTAVLHLRIVMGAERAAHSAWPPARARHHSPG